MVGCEFVYEETRRQAKHVASLPNGAHPEDTDDCNAILRRTDRLKILGGENLSMLECCRIDVMMVRDFAQHLNSPLLASRTTLHPETKSLRMCSQRLVLLASSSSLRFTKHANLCVATVDDAC